MPSVIPPFIVGLIAAPLLKKVARPVLRGAVKGSISLVAEVKRAAHEAGEGLQDLAAEATADLFAADLLEPEPAMAGQPRANAAEAMKVG